MNKTTKCNVNWPDTWLDLGLTLCCCQTFRMCLVNLPICIFSRLHRAGRIAARKYYWHLLGILPQSIWLSGFPCVLTISDIFLCYTSSQIKYFHDRKGLYKSFSSMFDLNILPLETQLLIPKQLVLKHFVFLVQIDIKRIRLDHKKCAVLAFLNPLIGLV